MERKACRTWHMRLIYSSTNLIRQLVYSKLELMQNGQKICLDSFLDSITMTCGFPTCHLCVALIKKHASPKFAQNQTKGRSDFSLGPSRAGAVVSVMKRISTVLRAGKAQPALNGCSCKTLKERRTKRHNGKYVLRSLH